MRKPIGFGLWKSVWMCASSLLVLALVLGTVPSGGAGSIAFADDKSDTADKPKSPSDKAVPAGKPVAQPLDVAYTKEIRENTTEPYFSTEFVDHLPASATVPTPEKILGYAIGTPNKLTYTKDIYRYYRELAKASPRVKVWTAGKSEEGREFLMVAVTDDSNMAQLEKYKQITAKLADPRKITEAEAQQLIKDGKPFYWASGSIHSPETGSPEMLMELAYRLAVEDSPTIQKIRKSLIFLITPVVEVDGRDRMVDIYNYRKADEKRPAPGLIYWGHYVAHDNNRDGIVMSLKLSEMMMKNFLDWHPQVLHDLHESVPYLYTSTGTGPYNAWLDPIVISEWQKMAYYEIENMTARGVPGVWTHGFYDGWAPNYMFYVANGHNSIGRFYETFGNGGADTRERSLPGNQTSREWFRPNPPMTRVKWSIRNNVNMQQSALILALSYTADHGQEFLENFYLKSKRSVAKAMTEGPAAWVIPNDGRRPTLSAQLARLLQKEGAEVHKLDQDVEVKETMPAPPAGGAAGGPGGAPGGGRGGAGRPAGAGAPAESGAPPQGARPDGARPEGPRTATLKIPAGSYVVRMDQPYSRMADMLLDTQFYSVNDPAPYDDTGWTLGPLRNVKTIRVTDNSFLKAPMTLVAGPARFTGGISGAAGTKSYLVNATAEPALATLRFRLKDVKMFAAEEAFEADGAKFSTGSFVIPTDGNPSDVRSRLETAAKDLGLRLVATDADVKVARHALALPRIAVMHSWLNTQNDGWFRLGLDEMEVPYSYISDLVVRDTPNLKSKFDVIIYPPLTASVPALINGVPKRMLDDGSDFGGPIPWKRSDITPNLDGSPDQTDDIRGGLGFAGLANLNKFIEDGGVFIPISVNANLPVALGMTQGVTIATTNQLRARGSVLRANVDDKASPIAYGYDDTLAIYFNQAPVFRVAAPGAGGGFGGGGGGAGGPGGEGGGGRSSGRGSLTDPDIPQGRPFVEPPRGAPPEDAPQGPQFPTRMQPRVVLRFSPERDLWISGMLAGGSELAGSPAVVDVPYGRGHIVLFANNPMWRQETHGSFMLIMNTALNFDHLQAGRKEPPARGSSAAGDADADNDWMNF
jgi:hypothetical protein